jgi:hypothetical protein
MLERLVHARALGVLEERLVVAASNAFDFALGQDLEGYPPKAAVGFDACPVLLRRHVGLHMRHGSS